MNRPRMSVGRPEATSHAAIEQAAFRLFGQHGFERTTLDDIAREVGVSRRTLFRYYGSKNDIPWGQFDSTLARFRDLLDDIPQTVPVHEAVHRAVIEFNRFDEAADPSHLSRMRLILTTPALQSHSTLQYAEWRQVIADYVARRTGAGAKDLGPQLVARVSLALAISAYEQWLQVPERSLLELIDGAMQELRNYLAD